MRDQNRLRTLRKRAGLTQTKLGELAGISQPAISQIESDTRPLTVDWMRALARILECAPADLLGDADNPDRLNDDERALIEHYRGADRAQRELLRRLLLPIDGAGNGRSE